MRLKKGKTSIDIRNFLGKHSIFPFEDRPIVSLIWEFV